jgi:hypothetical protein
MRRWIILFLLSFFIWHPAYAQKNKPGPDEWDFGQVKQGAVLKHNFVLKNESDDILTINSVNTSCGCTVSKADKNSLLPQESTAIKVTFNSRGYLGQVRQYVYVNTNSADTPIIKFTIKAQVYKEGK